MIELNKIVDDDKKSEDATTTRIIKISANMRMPTIKQKNAVRSTTTYYEEDIMG
jgi:hypothetical protein